MLHHLIYLSQATTALDDQQLRQLLAQARTHNQAAGITGILLYGQQQFLQLLEGEAAPVQALYARIRQDPRHREVTLYADKEIQHRAFEGWAMAYHPQDPGQLPAVAGLRSPAGLDLAPPRLMQADQQLLRLLRSFVLP